MGRIFFIPNNDSIIQ